MLSLPVLPNRISHYHEWKVVAELPRDLRHEQS